MNSIAPTSLESSPQHCKNCGDVVTKTFCPDCGQRNRAERLSLKAILVDIPSQWLSLDKGFFYTFLLQFKAPGQVARRYVQGERIKFTSPLTYYLIGAAVQLLMLFFSAEQLKSELISKLSSSTEQLAQLQQIYGDNAANIYADVYISVINQGYTYLGFVFLCLPFAFMVWAFSRRHRAAYNGAETLIFSFYTMGHFVMTTGLMGFITVRYFYTYHAPLSLVFYLVYCLISTRGFYTKQQHSVIASILALVFAFVLFMVTLLIATSIAMKSAI
ncbi:DUF3667 domain-containing protein [Alteromonas sediminis]|uniref:DUF3667 domain-containing protein n=1 Tax=Alteromonas sediminis TaxID=2259342 RepID=A0A3N5Z725_9ALTE|nr:DUF3667 domain-containing protein [Alteromonas sediminis]RPJ66474.1 DUF3667 domain-containing protein [Alteromonas sediminis]